MIASYRGDFSDPLFFGDFLQQRKFVDLGFFSITMA